MALDAYNENKSKYVFLGDNITYQTLIISVTQPFGAPSVDIEMPIR